MFFFVHVHLLAPQLVQVSILHNTPFAPRMSVGGSQHARQVKSARAVIEVKLVE